MSKVTIYHNPRCTKSRQTLALLEKKGCDVDIVEYLKNPPTVAKLDELLKAMGKEPLEVIRTKEAAFKDLGLSESDRRPRQEWLKLMVQNPVLIERPIVVKGKKAALGRPPENVVAIL